MPDMTAFYSMASRAKHARDAAMKRILSADPLIGSEWSAPACHFFAVVIPGHEKRFRICYFDADGFSGHVERDEPAAELFSMFGSQVEAWSGALETLSAGWIDLKPTVRECQDAACIVGASRVLEICGSGGLSGASSEALKILIQEARQCRT